MLKINLDEINKIKNSINYNQKRNINIKNYYVDKNSNKIYTINDIKFRNSNYLLNMMLNGNKFIIINTDLWELLCENNKEKATPVMYKINYNFISFKLDDQRKLYFENKKNNQFSLETFYKNHYSLYNDIKSNFNGTIINIYNDIIDFYNFQNKFILNLNNTYKSDIMSGYLVEIDWFKNWEKYNDYSNIKSKYLNHQINKKEIINHIIDIQQINKMKNFNLDVPKINLFCNKEQLESFLKKNELIIVNTSLIKSLNNYKNKIVYYYLYNKKIEFYFQSQEPYILKTESNIIAIKKKNIEHPNLLQLARIFYFRKYLKEEISKEHEVKNTNNSIVFIKKNIIDNYIKNYNYELLSKFLDTINIDYTNLEQKYEPLLNTLKLKCVDYYKEFKIKESLNNLLSFIGNEYNLIPQWKNINGKNLSYISDFEIIDNKILTFFMENKMLDENSAIKGEYLSENGKIFLILDYKAKSYYQIGNFDKENGNFFLEYILEGTSCNKKKYIKFFGYFRNKKFVR